MVDAIGWTQLYNGNLLSAAFTMYDFYLSGWTVVVLFLVYQFMLILKTRNMTLSWVTGVMFLALFSTSVLIKAIALQVIFILLVFELAAIFYLIFWK